MDKLKQEWNLRDCNEKLAIKQKELSLLEQSLPDLQEIFDISEHKLELKENELSLQIETNNEKMSDKKIMTRVIVNNDYQLLKAEYIIAKSKLYKCKTEIGRLYKELKTLEQMARNISMEIKYQLR